MKIQMKASVEVVTRRADVCSEPETATCGRSIEGVITRQQRRPNGAASQNLNIRVPHEVLDAARAKAAERQETLSSAVVAFLREYAGQG
jgi:predicted HicB family RNase H-like nuclease